MAEISSPTYHLRIFDQNVYGVPFAKDMAERTQRLQGLVAHDGNGDGRPDADIVALQELFTCSQRGKIQNRFDSHRYKYLPPQIDWKLTTSGLGTLSQYPLVEKHFQSYPREIGAASDRLANKGISHVRIKHPELGLIDVFNTHTQAAYDDPDQYEEVRAGQVVTLAKFVKKHSSPDRLSIICGDMNMIRGSRVDQIFHLLFPDYTDVLEAKYPDGVPPTRRRDNPYVCGDESDCDEKDEALEYVVARAPQGMVLDLPATTVQLVREFEGAPVSDHDGVMVDLALKGEPPPPPQIQKRRTLFDLLKPKPKATQKKD